MIVVLLTGRSGSKSVPKKNIYPLLGRPLAYYPMFAAKQAEFVDAVYVSTDDNEIKRIARELDVKVIDRPSEIAQGNSELVDAISHAMDNMEEEIDILVTMHCNCAVHLPGIVDECIQKLLADPEADSCVTGYIDNSAHPYRTKQIDSSGYLDTWLDIPEQVSTNRQQIPGCFILDGAVRAIKVDRCFPPVGQRPFTYLGNTILPLENISGGDVHSLVDIKLAEYHLKKLGWQEKEEQ